MTPQGRETENLKMSPLNPSFSADLSEASKPNLSNGLNVLDASTFPRARHLVISPPEQPGTQIAGWSCFTGARGTKLLLPDLSASSLPNDAPSVPDGFASDPAFRNGYWLVLFGEAASKAFAHGCEIDLRPARFKDQSVIQTVLFHTSVTIIRDDIQGQPAFHLFGCSSYGHHIYQRLSHLQTIYGGGFVDLTTLQSVMDTQTENS